MRGTRLVPGWFDDYLTTMLKFARLANDRGGEMLEASTLANDWWFSILHARNSFVRDRILGEEPNKV